MYYKTDTEQRMAEMESTICKSRCENEQKAVQVGDGVEAMEIILELFCTVIALGNHDEVNAPFSPALNYR